MFLIFLMSVYTTFILCMYLKNLSVPISKSNENRLRVKEELKKIDSTLPIAMKISAVVVVLFFYGFYFTAAVVVDNIIFTLVSALFIVIGVKTIKDAFKVINNKGEMRQFKWYDKLHSVAGLVYTVYFIYFYFNLHQADHLGSLISGAIVALLFRIALKLQSNKKEAL